MSRYERKIIVEGSTESVEAATNDESKGSPLPLGNTSTNLFFKPCSVNVFSNIDAEEEVGRAANRSTC